MNELDERCQKILWAIIQTHISSNCPIGSRTVMKNFSMSISSATIRNAMADLEELGYVTQPYTSAGRIPTEKGYRLYVDSLLRECTSINKRLLQQIICKLRSIEKDINKLIKETSKTLSVFSNYIGIATHPKSENMVLKRIEFLRHTNNKILSVLISEDGIVKNKIIVLEEDIFTQRQLDKINRYLNNKLRGLTVREIKDRILFQMAQEKRLCDRLIDKALVLCKKAIEMETENYGEIFGVFNVPDFATMEQIKEIFRAIEEKHLMVKLLDKIVISEGVQVFIGSENFLLEMKDLSVVLSTYNDGQRPLGAIGIIGPTRMNYLKVIPFVNHTAKALTQILSEG